eukprot:COSAG02_NODE_17926_length_973_cov_1.024083_1_plen_33_part_10
MCQSIDSASEKRKDLATMQVEQRWHQTRLAACV